MRGDVIKTGGRRVRLGCRCGLRLKRARERKKKRNNKVSNKEDTLQQLDTYVGGSAVPYRWRRHGSGGIHEVNTNKLTCVYVSPVRASAPASSA